MTGDQQTLLFKVLLFVAIAAFYPQLAKLWRRLGYRKEGEVDTTSPKRIVFVLLAVEFQRTIGAVLAVNLTCQANR